MKGNPPDQMPEPVSYSQSIGNSQIHNAKHHDAQDLKVEQVEKE